MDRREIDARLQRLWQDVPSMLVDAEDEDDFWRAFAGEADLIEGAPAERIPAQSDAAAGWSS